MELELEITTQKKLNFNRDLVFNTLCHNTKRLDHFIVAINSIEPVTAYKDENGIFIRENRWFIDDTYVPGYLVKWFGEEALCWTVNSRWIKDEWRCYWETQAGDLDFVGMSGYIDYQAVHDNMSKLAIHVDITIEQVPGLPYFLKNKAQDLCSTTARSVLNMCLDALEDNLNDFIESAHTSQKVVN